ncbi:RNase P subunit Rpr2 [Tubulinosema ratisbonensis]|uniref:RNase P subunit Rpr2 n=1 Tax=Tubulinosema ratisbonensis TaxID=291195 RepID=A0A437AK44_9MICR|nr:RNase P subunit Rpr2 [Tubulinosema ratisbonensis]
MKKKKQNNLLNQLTYLFNISYKLAPIKTPYIKKLLALSEKYQIRLSKQIKRSICKKCKSILIANLNCESKVERKSEGMCLITVCFSCKNEIKIVYQNKIK